MADADQKGDEEFGFVSRDVGVLERVEGEREEEEVAGPDVEQAAGVTGDETGQQGADGGERSQRDSMASVASSGRASDVAAPTNSSPVKSKASKTEVTLPQTFQVKYLGRRDARGLWGIKHTRRPVDAMVAAAKSASTGAGVVLPVVRLVVASDGVTITETPRGKDKTASSTVAFHAIDSISYGVQDLVYTRVFSMIVVREAAELRGQHPFECHAFVCDSRAHARKLTYALAAAFHEYSRAVKSGEAGLEGVGKKAKKFAIDLRTPEQIEKELQTPQEADSEA